VFSSENAVRIRGLENIRAVSLAASHAAAVDADGVVYTWGTGESGELGSDAERHPTPTVLESARIFTVK
jgi:alpha-tubulin suppressor-like RCC1 family protein